MINGWTITEIEPGWEFRFRVTRGNYEEKFYSRAAAERYAETHP